MSDPSRPPASPPAQASKGYTRNSCPDPDCPICNDPRHRLASDETIYHLHLRAADAPRAHPSDVLLMALKRVTAGMDRAGHMDGWPECPWCHDAGSDDIHAPECELLLARQVIADVEHGIGAVSRPHPETPSAAQNEETEDVDTRGDSSC